MKEIKMRDCKIPQQTLIQYVRDNNRTPRGIVVAIKLSNGKIGIGWSLCRKNERFIKDMGLQIAIGRAMTLNDDNDNQKTLMQRIHDEETCKIRFFAHGENEPILPRKIKSAMIKFFTRCEKYYRV